MKNLYSIPNFIKMDNRLCDMFGAEVFVFLHPCDLEWKSRSLRLVSKHRVQ